MEALRERRTAQRSGLVADYALRAGNFGSERSIFDPLTRRFEQTGQASGADPFPNQTIPQSRFNPISTALLEFYPQPTRSGPNNYERNATFKNDFEQHLQRIDYQRGADSSWFGRYSQGGERINNGPLFSNQSTHTNTRAYQAMASNTQIISPTTLNELRIGYSQFQNDRIGYFARTRNVVDELGVVGLTAAEPSTWGVPNIGLDDGLAGFGDPTSGPWVNRNHIFQVTNSLSTVHGSHSIKLGGEIRRDHYNSLGAQFIRGSFNFRGQSTANPSDFGNTGHSFADFLIGEASQSTKGLGFANARLRTTSSSLFIQDTWRLGSRITLDIGLRYEITPPHYDQHNAVMNVQVFDMGVGPGGLLPDRQTPIVTRPGAGDFYDGVEHRYADGIPVQRGNATLGRRLVRVDKNDLAPRLGIAWSPSERWAVRAGAGLFYSQDIGNARFDLARNLAPRDRMNADRLKPNSNLSDPWVLNRQSFPCSDWDGPCIGQPYFLANIPSRRTPEIWQWLFNVQRRLAESVMLEVGYQGNAGSRLERLRPFNEALQRSGPDDLTSRIERRPWPVFNTVQELDGVGHSSYHSFRVRAERRYASGLSFLAAYTWSKAIDSGSGIRTGGGDRLFPATNYDLSRERGLSQFHIGRRLTTAALYEIPMPIAGPLKTILGGWQAGGILTVSEGPPANVGNIGDRNDTGTSNFPDATGISPVVVNPTAERFWEVAAFDTTNPELSYLYGNSGRNTLPLPGFQTLDLILSKETVIGERHRLQFRVEAFNSLNHPNWNPPGSNPRNTRNFGFVFGAKEMREIQLGVKYLF